MFVEGERERWLDVDFCSCSLNSSFKQVYVVYYVCVDEEMLIYTFFFQIECKARKAWLQSSGDIVTLPK